MQVLRPLNQLTDEERKRRLNGGILQPGERIHFDIMLADSLSGPANRFADASAIAEAEAVTEYILMCDHLHNAWKRSPADPLRDAIKDGIRTQDAATEVNDAYSAMVDDLTNAWKPK